MLALDWDQRVVDWAKGQSLVRQVHLFGSRARGTNRLDSHLDLSTTLACDEDKLLSTWLFHKGRWSRALEECLGILVHLEPGHRSLCSSDVLDAVLSEGRLIYLR